MTIKEHTSSYHEDLSSHTFCIAWPGDGWSSRVLDAVVHGCIPVVIQDESHMFLEGVFETAGMGFDYQNFSIRIPEAEQHELVKRLSEIPTRRVLKMQRLVGRVRDYFVYKDMYNPNTLDRRRLLSLGRSDHDAFLMIIKGLEARARAIGVRVPPSAPLTPL